MKPVISICPCGVAIQYIAEKTRRGGSRSKTVTGNTLHCSMRYPTFKDWLLSACQNFRPQKTPGFCCTQNWEATTDLVKWRLRKERVAWVVREWQGPLCTPGRSRHSHQCMTSSAKAVMEGKWKPAPGKLWIPSCNTSTPQFFTWTVHLVNVTNICRFFWWGRATCYLGAWEKKVDFALAIPRYDPQKPEKHVDCQHLRICWKLCSPSLFFRLRTCFRYTYHISMKKGKKMEAFVSNIVPLIL